MITVKSTRTLTVKDTSLNATPPVTDEICEIVSNYLKLFHSNADWMFQCGPTNPKSDHYKVVIEYIPLTISLSEVANEDRIFCVSKEDRNVTSFEIDGALFAFESTGLDFLKSLSEVSKEINEKVGDITAALDKEQRE